MAAILTYQLNVNEGNVAAALANVEKRFIRHQARVNHILGMGAGGIRMKGGAGGGGGPGGVIREARAATQQQSRAIKLTRDQTTALKQYTAEQRVGQRYELAAHREKLKAVERLKRAEIGKIRTVRLASLREREQSNKSFRSAAMGGGGNAVGRLSSVGKAGIGMLGVGGAVTAGAAVTQALKLDEQIRRFTIAGRSAGSAGMDPGVVRKQIMSTAMDRGIAPEAVMAGVQQFQTVTGNGDMALKMADRFATFAQATGGDPAEIADAAASLFQNLNIKDIDALTESLAKLTFQGKAGSFEFKDMAAQLPRVTAALAGRGIGGGGEGVAKMGAALQVIQRGTGDAAVTSTAFDSVLRQMVAKAGDIQGGKAFSTGSKVDVFEGGDPNAAFRGDFDHLIADVLKASGGNAIELQKVFGDEGMKGMNMFSAAFKGAGGGDAGHAAVLKLFEEFEQVGGNYAEVQRDAADVQKSTSIQLEIAMMELKEIFASELMPAVKDLAPLMRDMAPHVKTAVEALVALGGALANNPLMGLGAVIGASVGTEIMKAQLASVIQGGVVTPLGAFGLALTGVSAGIIAFTAWLEGKVNEGKAKADAAAERGDVIRQKAKEEMDAKGVLSPETRKELQALDAMETKTSADAAATTKEGFFSAATRTAGALVGVDSAEAETARIMALQGTNASEKYQSGVQETKTLLGADKLAQQYGPENFKAAAVGDAIAAAAVAKINASTLNRGDAPAKPVVK